MSDIANREDMNKKPAVAVKEAGKSGGDDKQDKAEKVALTPKVLRPRWIIAGQSDYSVQLSVSDSHS